jgi:SAM-dependent methyltransferase
MLGGLEYLDEADISKSEEFLMLNIKDVAPSDIVLDVGSGVGRISSKLLSKTFRHILLLDPDERFLEVGRVRLGATCKDTIACRLQEFTSDRIANTKVRLVWIQWVLIYLSDGKQCIFMPKDAIVRSLGELRRCLQDGGLIIAKENVIIPDQPDGSSGCDDIVIDRVDHSVTRTESHLLSLFVKSGFRIMSRMEQTGFPDHLYPVVMYAFAKDSS